MAAARTTDHSISVNNLSKAYGEGPGRVQALHNVTGSFARGSFTAIMGPSGSGKSTMLLCMAGLEQPSSGSVIIANKSLERLDDEALTKLRLQYLGFIFQSFNLLPALTAIQNVALPLRLAGKRPDYALLQRLLDQVGLGERAKHFPSQLSGGQQQRVAIARALATKPEVLFADEPTGALDSNSGKEVLGIIRNLVDKHGQTVIMVTHDPVAAAHADTVMFLVDGQVVDSLDGPSVTEVGKYMTSLEKK